MNTAYLGDELRALRDTLGLTDLGRAFMAKHAEIFGDAPASTPAQDATALADKIEAISQLGAYIMETREAALIVAALRATSQMPDAVAWQWRYVGSPDWNTPSGGQKLSQDIAIEHRPLYAHPQPQQADVQTEFPLESGLHNLAFPESQQADDQRAHLRDAERVSAKDVRPRTISAKMPGTDTIKGNINPGCNHDGVNSERLSDFDGNIDYEGQR